MRHRHIEPALVEVLVADQFPIGEDRACRDTRVLKNPSGLVVIVIGSPLGNRLVDLVVMDAALLRR